MKSINLKRIVFIIIACNVVLYSCKKTYPEGPHISFRDVNVRITGEWEATSLTINGQDKLYIIDSLNVARYRFQFPKNPTYGSKYVGNYVAIDKQGNDIHPDTAFNICWFNFNDNFEEFHFFPSSGGPSMPKPLVFFPGYYQYTHLIDEQWKILKLTYKELKWQSIEYDIIIEMKKVKELRLYDN